LRAKAWLAGSAILLKQLQDAELAALAAATGEPRAFGELARRHATRVRALLRRMGASSALADDVAQEAFIIAFKHLATYRNQGSFYSWVGKIAARLYVRRWKSESRIEYSRLPVTEAVESAETLAPHDAIDLDHALQSLSVAERLCVTLCHGAGCSHSEIAAQLDVPIGTVKSHIRRGLYKLKTRLDADTQR
jgi:RNA polymerase sigma-70 factor (ECF subfamily)